MIFIIKQIHNPLFSGQNTNFEEDLEALERWFRNLVPLTPFLTKGITDLTEFFIDTKRAYPL